MNLRVSSLRKRIEEDYHTIKDDTPLVSVYTTKDVTVRGMLITNDLLIDAIKDTQAYMDYVEKFERVDVPTIKPGLVKSTQRTNRTPRATRAPNPDDVQKRKGKQDAGETSSPKPSLKIIIKQKKVTPTTPLPPSDDQERDDILEATQLGLALEKTAKVYEEQQNMAAVEEKLLQEDVKKIVEGDDDDNDDDDDHDDHALIRTQDTLEKVNEDLKDIVPKLATSATNDIIKDNLLRLVTDNIKKERESSQPINTIINVHPTTKLWDVLKAKFKKSSALVGPCRIDAFRKCDHDDHQGDDAPPEGEKSAKRQKTSKISKSARGSSSKQPGKETNTSASERQQQQHYYDTWVDDPVIDEDEATLRDILSNQFRDAKEYAYHLEQSQNYMENQLVWESRQEDLRRPKPNALVFYGPHRNPNEPSRYLYNKDLFFLKYENTKEKSTVVDSTLEMYKIRHKKVRDDLEEVFFDYRIVKIIKVTTDQKFGLDYMERIVKLCNLGGVHDFQLGIESYHIKINLTAPALIFPGIEECNLFSIVDKLTTGLIYLNNKNEKRFMDLQELSKFCDATLEKMLKEVKMKIFETEFMKKTPLLRRLDLKIMKAYEREITKRLKNLEHMRRWESFVNGKSILSTMKR
ncbi:hypothetical protein Tco_1219142 [Tanacetum coccineum]